MNIMAYSIKIASVHANRLQYALDNLQKTFPLNPTAIENLDMDQLLLIELLISRFSKLQDFMGNQLFNLLLSKAGESIDEMTFIDKINKLEKLRVIESA
jgi:hypothetical protein